MITIALIPAAKAQVERKGKLVEVLVLHLLLVVVVVLMDVHFVLLLLLQDDDDNRADSCRTSAGCMQTQTC